MIGIVAGLRAAAALRPYGVLVTATAPDVTSPQRLAELLDAQGYLADEGVATAAFLALAMGRPLFVRG